MYRKMPKVRRAQPDLTRTKGAERSVGAKIEDLVKTCNQYGLEELKRRLVAILDDPNTSISKRKNLEYKNYMYRINSKLYMMEFIKNIYLASAAMPIT